MNDVERLHADLSGRFPEHRIEIDAPETETGSWFLTVFRDDHQTPVVIEYRPDRGFGVSTPGPDDYGTGVDEIYPTVKAAYDRIVRLVLSGGEAVPPMAVLGWEPGLSREKPAGPIAGKEANSSHIENRGNLLISRIAQAIGAMSGTYPIQGNIFENWPFVFELGKLPTQLRPETSPSKTNREGPALRSPNLPRRQQLLIRRGRRMLLRSIVDIENFPHGRIENKQSFADQLSVIEGNLLGDPIYVVKCDSCTFFFVLRNTSSPLPRKFKRKAAIKRGDEK